MFHLPIGSECVQLALANADFDHELLGSAVKVRVSCWHLDFAEPFLSVAFSETGNLMKVCSFGLSYPNV